MHARYNIAVIIVLHYSYLGIAGSLKVHNRVQFLQAEFYCILRSGSPFKFTLVYTKRSIPVAL